MKTNYSKLLLINLAIIAFLLIAMEMVSRFVLDKIYNRNFDASLLVDNKYGTSPGLKENASGMVWGKVLHTDNSGCRKSLRPYMRGKKKWLFIGDSVTEGVGVDDSTVFSSLLAQKIDSLNIQNYALIGYSVADYLNVLNKILEQDDSSVGRVTVFFCLNDVYGNMHVKDLPVMRRQNFAGRLNAFLQDYYYTYKLIKLFMFRSADRYFEYDLQFYKEDNTYFINAMNILKQCDLLCQAAGAEFKVVLLPYRPQLSGKDLGNKVPQDLIEKFCTQNGIPWLDPLEYFMGRQNPESFYLFADEIHLSEKGHYAMARYILSH